jgi:streptomycin 6-kinase
LEIDGALTGGSMSVVLTARRGGDDVVLKLAAPWSEWSAAEAAALAAWNGELAPRLIESADEGRDLLLERIHPGVAPERLSPKDVACLVAGLSAAGGAAAARVPPLVEAVAQRFRRATENRHALLDAGRLDRARAAAVELASEGRPPRGLLHGDLLRKNVLSCERRGLVAIDPTPALGETAYDAALWAITEPPVDQARARCEAVAAELGLDGVRVWRWAQILGAVEVCLAPRERARDTRALLTQVAPSWWRSEAG